MTNVIASALRLVRSFNHHDGAGFRAVAELKGPGGSQGYAWVDCNTGVTLP